MLKLNDLQNCKCDVDYTHTIQGDLVKTCKSQFTLILNTYYTFRETGHFEVCVYPASPIVNHAVLAPVPVYSMSKLRSHHRRTYKEKKLKIASWLNTIDKHIMKDYLA